MYSPKVKHHELPPERVTTTTWSYRTQMKHQERHGVYDGEEAFGASETPEVDNDATTTPYAYIVGDKYLDLLGGEDGMNCQDH